MFKAAKNESSLQAKPLDSAPRTWRARQCHASQYIEGNKRLHKVLLGGKPDARGTEYYCFDDCSVIERRPDSSDEYYEEWETMPWKAELEVE